MKQHTVLVIAHRLSTIQDADRILYDPLPIKGCDSALVLPLLPPPMLYHQLLIESEGRKSRMHGNVCDQPALPCVALSIMSSSCFLVVQS